MTCLRPTAMALFVALSGVAQAAPKTELLNDTCWNIPTGDLAPSRVYVLSSIAKHYPSTQAAISVVFSRKQLTQQDRTAICEAVQAAEHQK